MARSTSSSSFATLVGVGRWVVLTVLLGCLWSAQLTAASPTGSKDATDTRSKDGEISSDHDDCRHFPGADRVMIMLKTGATALYDRFPVHIETTLKCVPNVLVLSDFEQTLGGYHIQDVLTRVSESTRTSHPNFELYRQIHRWAEAGQDFSKLDTDAAWHLDRWKFLPMIHHAWETASDRIDWFVMIEADTSMSWVNLLHFLQTKDPKQPYFGGARTYLVVDMSTFAHGGSGILLSRAAIEKLEAKRNDAEGGVVANDRVWEERTGEICCGDATLAHALKDVDVEVEHEGPRIQGDTPLTFPWESNAWCEAPITWHHVTAAEVDEMYQFERNWTRAHGPNTPFLFRDVFHRFVEPRIAARKKDWDNLSDGIKFDEKDDQQKDLEEPDRSAVKSAEACTAACEATKECMQWKWRRGQCSLGKTIRFGKRDRPDENGVTDRWTSGWMVERITKFTASQPNCTETGK